MRIHYWFRVWCFSLLATCLPLRAAFAYQFSVMADNTGFINLLQDNPITINDAGVVAFRAILDNGYEGVYTSDGNNLTEIVNSTGEFGGFLGPRINNKGQVAFKAFLDSGYQGVYLNTGTTITPIIQSTAGNLLVISNDSVDLNNHGVVTFEYNHYAAYDSILAKGTAGQLTTIAEIPDYQQTYRVYRFPRINDNGDVTVMAFSSVGNRPAIFKGNQSGLTLVASETPPFQGLGLYPSFNNQGVVAFSAAPSSNNPSARVGIYTTSDGSTFTPYVDVPLATDTSFYVIGGISLNDSGQVAYVASSSLADNRLFLGNEVIIERGTAFLGSTISDLQFSEGGLNNLGQVAFYLRLADGRQMIVRGDPDTLSVPEPSSLAGITFALGFAIVFKRTRRTTGQRRDRVSPKLRSR